MSAADQLPLFEPDPADAARLLAGYIREAELAAGRADRFDLLQMGGAAAQADRATASAIESATVCAIYLDLLQAAGESL